MREMLVVWLWLLVNPGQETSLCKRRLLSSPCRLLYHAHKHLLHVLRIAADKAMAKHERGGDDTNRSYNCIGREQWIHLYHLVLVNCWIQMFSHVSHVSQTRSLSLAPSVSLLIYLYLLLRFQLSLPYLCLCLNMLHLLFHPPYLFALPLAHYCFFFPILFQFGSSHFSSEDWCREAQAWPATRCDSCGIKVWYTDHWLFEEGRV